MITHSLIELIGNTPLLDISPVVPEGGARLLAKLEGMNPGGSIKDRPALAMIEKAEAEGLLKPGMTGHGKITCCERSIFHLITRRLVRYIRVEFWSWW